MDTYKFRRGERIKSRKIIDYIFCGGARSFSNFPIRVVYKTNPNPKECYAQILVSVSKKRFKHAVDRNRVKRLIREAYRLNKHPLIKHLEKQNKHLVISFIYLSTRHISLAEMEDKLKTLMNLMIEDDYTLEETVG